MAARPSIAVSADLAYQELLRLYRERALIESCAGVLEWDAETYLPQGGAELRSEQQALLARLEHERAIDRRIPDLLAEAEAEAEAAPAADPVRVGNLREIRREHERAVRTPAALVEDFARATTLAQDVWATAMAGGESDEYLAHLARVVALVQAHADCLRAAGESRYDVCLDAWEPGLRDAELERLCGPLREQLTALAGRILGAPTPAADPTATRHLLDGAVPVAARRELLTRLVARLGFDLRCGRIDEAAHPSTMRLGPGDVRLTTRLGAERPLGWLFSTLHELGHGLYDQRLPAERFGEPVGDVASLALHEGQARLVENVVGKSRSFWAFLLPELAAVAPELRSLDGEEVYAAVNRVAFTSDRVSADEVTYDLHIALRVDLERALLRGDLAVADLPTAWDDAAAAVLARPRSRRDGFLQDGHWAAGMFGYFPTYTLGNMIAAQLFRAATRDAPVIDDALRAGSLAPLVDWMDRAVYRHAGALSPAEIVARATGAPVSPHAHVAYLTEKYGALYDL